MLYRVISLIIELEALFVVLSAIDLRQRLLDLGALNQPFTIRPGLNSDLYLEHKIVDAKFYGIASKEKVKITYAAKIWLIEEDHALKYQEIIQEERGSGGLLPAPKLGLEKTAFKGKVLFKKEKGIGFGLKKPMDPSSFGKVYDYDFDVERVRDSIKKLVEASGWRFEQVLLAPGTASHREDLCDRCGSTLLPGAVFCVNCGRKVK
jgi:hypothetical protein